MHILLLCRAISLQVFYNSVLTIFSRDIHFYTKPLIIPNAYYVLYTFSIPIIVMHYIYVLYKDNLKKPSLLFHYVLRKHNN